MSQNYLSIRKDGKGIPCGGSCERREDGEANFGFKNLKQNPALIDSVPELAKDAALKSLVRALNQRSCGLVTVGCEVGEVVELQGSRYSGYVEFAINSAAAVQNAANYFSLFFHFDRALFDGRFPHRVQLNWELEGAHFSPAEVAGFTCSIFINTDFYPTLALAAECWSATL